MVVKIDVSHNANLQHSGACWWSR